MNNFPTPLKDTFNHLQMLISKGEHLEERLKELELNPKNSKNEQLKRYSTWHARVVMTLTPLMRAIQVEEILKEV